MKKVLFSKLYSSKPVLSGLLIISFSLYPLSAQASLMSFFGFSSGADTTISTTLINHNSQNIPLPTASIRLQNPKGGQGGGDISVDDNALLADSGPLGTGADVSNYQISTSDTINVYVVKKGDSLPVIAQMFGVTVNTILWGNDMNKGDSITPGQVLTILPISGISYTVLKGDTISSIAKKLKSNAEEIGKYNGFELDSKLDIGSILIIPDGELGSSEISTPVLSSNKTNTNTQIKPLPKGNSNLPVVAYGRTRAIGGYDGPDLGNYFLRPIKGGVETQGIHGRNGVDLAGVPVGTPVLAAAEGLVIIAKNSGWNGGFGNYVVINHANGSQTLYGHLKKATVEVGQIVSRGEQIGLLGSSGRSTGAHVHFEVHNAENPLGADPNYTGQ